MSSLYLFQFAALVFMLVNALFVALARLNARWKNKRYERSRLMIFLALVLLSAQYYVQMRFHIRATDDHLGAMVNMLVYTPCFGLIAMAIYNLEAVQAKRRNMALALRGVLCCHRWLLRPWPLSEGQLAYRRLALSDVGSL